VHSVLRLAKISAPGSEELYASERFMRHASGVISTVDTAVSLLAPDMDPLIEVLHDLGTKHAHYAVVG
jgi:hypothetical protein